MRIKVVILLCILLNSQSLATANTFNGNTYSFNMAPDYSFTSFTSAPLLWEDKANTTVSVNITLTNIPDVISSIVVDLITISLISSDTVFFVESKTTQQEIINVDDEVSFDLGITTPDITDSFYFNTSIYARTRGNFTQASDEIYTYRFPDSDTILVNRGDDIVPLINLYGFPPGSFFQAWLPIYGTVLGLVLFPGFIALGNSLVNKIKKEDEISE